MGLLLLKITLTPLLIGAASLAGRRWGAVIGGWLIALPLTSGPVAFFIALDQGPRFAAFETAGSLLGVGAIAAYAVVYAWVARRSGWPRAIAVAAVTFLVVGWLAQPVVGLPAGALLAIVLAGVGLGAAALPRLPAGDPVEPAPAWEIPARVLAGTLVVLALTAVAAALGPGLSGVIAIFPVFATILTVFTHRRDGATEGVAVLRGLLAGLYGTAAFFAILEVGLVPLGVAAGFLAALAGGGLLQGVALALLRGRGRQPAASASMAAR